MASKVLAAKRVCSVRSSPPPLALAKGKAGTAIYRKTFLLGKAHQVFIGLAFIFVLRYCAKLCEGRPNFPSLRCHYCRRVVILSYFNYSLCLSLKNTSLQITTRGRIWTEKCGEPVLPITPPCLFREGGPFLPYGRVFFISQQPYYWSTSVTWGRRPPSPYRSGINSLWKKATGRKTIIVGIIALSSL